MLIVDLDRFKIVNDRFGHLVGDAVLAASGARLASTVREYDTVGRFGGEEFVAVLPEADADDRAGRWPSASARRSTDAGRRPRRTRLDDSARTCCSSVSIGVADARRPTATELADLLHAADRALYRAKAGGRNRVRLAGRGAGEVRDRASRSVRPDRRATCARRAARRSAGRHRPLAPAPIGLARSARAAAPC